MSLNLNPNLIKILQNNGKDHLLHNSNFIFSLEILLKQYLYLLKPRNFKIKIRKNIPIEIDADVEFTWDGYFDNEEFLVENYELTHHKELGLDHQILLEAYLNEVSSYSPTTSLDQLEIVEEVNKAQNLILKKFRNRIKDEAAKYFCTPDMLMTILEKLNPENKTHNIPFAH